MLFTSFSGSLVSRISGAVQIVICLTVIVTALVTRKDLCEVRIRTGQTEVAVFTAYEPEE
ncbi:Hok/Gef family protein [Escherichia coli]|nr:Hok/Gef family protein [Escherichia coli]OTD52939.1 Hok/Gef family protein [Escherichia coli]OTE03238.1 Hok/Gef family protein [Escherichia coli]